MKTKNLNGLALLFAAALIITSCKKSATDDLAAYIPVDVQEILAINVNDLLSKSGLNDRENDAFRQNIIGLLGEGLNPAATEHLQKVISNPSESGIDTGSPVFYFSSPAFAYPILLAKVGNHQKLMNTFDILVSQGVSQQLEKTEEYTFANLAYGNICVFTESVMLVTTSYGSKQESRNQLVSLINANENNITNNAAYKNMVSAEGDIRFMMGFESLAGMNPYFSLRNQLEYLNNKDISFIGHLNFEKGKIKMNIQPFTENEEMKARIKQQADITGKIKGEFTNKFPASVLLYAAMNFNGEKLVDFLKTTPEVQQQFTNNDMALMLELLQSINGDLSIGLTDVSLEGLKLTMYAQAKSGDILDKLYNDGSFRIRKVKDNHYSMRSNSINFYFGMHKKWLYMTTDNSVADNIGENVDRSIKEAEYASNLTGKSQYVVVDFRNILSLPMVQFVRQMNNSMEYRIMFDLLARLSYVELNGIVNDKAEFNLYLIDKETNSLKQILNFARQQAGI